MAQKLVRLETNGYAGALFWHLNADYGFLSQTDAFAAYFHCGAEGEREGEGEFQWLKVPQGGTLPVTGLLALSVLAATVTFAGLVTAGHNKR